MNRKRFPPLSVDRRWKREGGRGKGSRAGWETGDAPSTVADRTRRALAGAAHGATAALRREPRPAARPVTAPETLAPRQEAADEAIALTIGCCFSFCFSLLPQGGPFVQRRTTPADACVRLGKLRACATDLLVLSVGKRDATRLPPTLWRAGAGVRTRKVSEATVTGGPLESRLKRW